MIGSKYIHLFIHIFSLSLQEFKWCKLQHFQLFLATTQLYEIAVSDPNLFCKPPLGRHNFSLHFLSSSSILYSQHYPMGLQITFELSIIPKQQFSVPQVFPPSRLIFIYYQTFKLCFIIKSPNAEQLKTIYNLKTIKATVYLKKSLNILCLKL